MAADRVVADFLTDGRLPSREACWRSLALWVGHWALRGFGMWAVTEVGWLLGTAWLGHGGGQANPPA